MANPERPDQSRSGESNKPEQSRGGESTRPDQPKGVRSAQGGNQPQGQQQGSSGQQQGQRQGSSGQNYSFRCADAGHKECSWQTQGKSPDEVLRQAEQHGREKHNMTNMDEETKNQVRSQIRAA